MKEIFGPFTFETTTRELRRDGEIVKLQSQPAQVLAILIEHAGDIVTRDALRAAIWGDDTFVDFDKGLNFAIAQVRTALGDSADAPTYVRTFPNAVISSSPRSRLQAPKRSRGSPVDTLRTSVDGGWVGP